MSLNKKIFVTKPYLPPLEEFKKRLPEIWESRILSNNGPMVRELEQKLQKYLGVNHLSLVSNATIGLMIALKAANVRNKVITSPFSFVATAQAISWNGAKPIFVDIDESDLNIDPNEIEKAISPDTTAILPIHCYGNLCNVEAISKIAKKYGLKVVYDAAHSFAADNDIGSTLNHGDFSVVSFHATKVFNTFEGGAIISKNNASKEMVDRLINFSLNTSKDDVDMLGINGKMSEIAALNGICQLKYIDEVIEKRKIIYKKYCAALSSVQGIDVVKISSGKRNGYSYMPILVRKSFRYTRDDFARQLDAKGIFSRKYFYPLLSNLSFYKDLDISNTKFQNASMAADQILCMPIYPDLSDEDFDYIVSVIQKLK